MILRVLALDWRIVGFFEGQAMSPAALGELFDECIEHQKWHRDLNQRKDKSRGRS